MALESATYINDLNAANPAATDGLAQADDHFRLIKGAVKATFPNVTGAINATHGALDAAATFAGAISASAFEINVLSGISTGLTSTELSVLDGITASTASLNLVGTLPVVGTLAEGSVVVGNSSSVATTLPIGATGSVLLSNGTTATWAVPAAQVSAVPAISKGQILVGNASSAYATISGTEGQVPTVTSTGTVAFADPAVIDVGAAGAVGTYVWARRRDSHMGNNIASSGLVYGSTYAGSDLRPAGLSVSAAVNTDAKYAADTGSNLSGTYRAMGYAYNNTSGHYAMTLMVRTA